MFIRHLWQLKTFVFLHRCLIRAVLFDVVVKPDSSSLTNKLECFARAGLFKPSLILKGLARHYLSGVPVRLERTMEIRLGRIL